MNKNIWEQNERSNQKDVNMHDLKDLKNVIIEMDRKSSWEGPKHNIRKVTQGEKSAPFAPDISFKKIKKLNTSKVFLKQRQALLKNPKVT